ncbi:MAG: TolC family protein [Acidobacteria bacterium]|nr:TolC family protein [Acidobacteriota bacterium]
MTGLQPAEWSLRKGTPIKRFLRVAALLAAGIPIFADTGVFAQQNVEETGFFSKSAEWFPRFYKPYILRTVPKFQPADSFGLQHLVSDGKIRISLDQLKEAVRENNLDFLALEIDVRSVETDLLRVKGGGAPRGGGGVQIPSSLFSGAIGAGVGGGGGLGGFSAGGVTGGARQVSSFPRGSYDPTLALGFSIGKNTSPLNSIVVSGVPEVTTKSIAFQSRYSQAFSTGSSLSVAFNNMRQRSTQRSLLYNPSFVSQLSVSVTQQLLSGFGLAIGRRFDTVADVEQKIMKEIVRQRSKTTFAAAETAYWDLAAAGENVRVAEESLEVARRFLADTQQREEFGTMSGLDVATAESEVAARERDLVTAQTTLRMREVDLKNMISRNFSSPLGTFPIEPVDALPKPGAEDIPELQDALNEAMKNRPEIRQAETAMLTQDLAIKYSKDLLRPSLLVFANFNSSGLYGDRTITDNYGNPVTLPGGFEQAFRQVRNWSYPDYAVGFTFSINLRNRAAEADYHRSKMEKRQTETTLERTKNSIGLEVRRALIGLVQSKARIDAADQAVRLSALTLEAEEGRFNEGMAIPYDLIRRRRDLLSAQFAAIQAKADYAKALVEMRRVTGKDD